MIRTALQKTTLRLRAEIFRPTLNRAFTLTVTELNSYLTIRPEIKYCYVLLFTFVVSSFNSKGLVTAQNNEFFSSNNFSNNWWPSKFEKFASSINDS